MVAQLRRIGNIDTVDKSSVRKGRGSIYIRQFSIAPTAAAAVAAAAMVTKFLRVPN